MTKKINFSKLLFVGLMAYTGMGYCVDDRAESQNSSSHSENSYDHDKSRSESECCAESPDKIGIPDRDN